MAQFLTDEWFQQVATLTEQAGELNLPANLSNLAINFIVSEQNQQVELNLSGALLSKGLSETAKTTLRLEQNLFRKIFLEFDTASAMTAFMMGKIKIEGDMMQLMALQSAKPSTEQKALYKQILQMTK